MSKVIFRGMEFISDSVNIENGLLKLPFFSCKLDKPVSIVFHGNATDVICKNAIVMGNVYDLYCKGADTSVTVICSDKDTEYYKAISNGSPTEETVVVKDVDSDEEVLEFYTCDSCGFIFAPDCNVTIDGFVSELCVTDSLIHYDISDCRNLCTSQVDEFSYTTLDNVVTQLSYVKPSGCGFEFAVSKEGSKRFKDAMLPVYMTDGAAAADFFCAEKVVIPPAEVIDGKFVAKPTLVHTGVKAYMESNHVLHLYNRSSNPKKGLVLANSVGVVDSDYYGNESNDGEIMFAFYNFSGEDLTIEVGDRIGQGEFAGDVLRPNCAKVNKSTRDGGFGSTGK